LLKISSWFRKSTIKIFYINQIKNINQYIFNTSSYKELNYIKQSQNSFGVNGHFYMESSTHINLMVFVGIIEIAVTKSYINIGENKAPLKRGFIGFLFF